MINQKEKGATFERKVANILKNYFGCDFHRTPQSGAFSTNTKDERMAGDVYTPQNFPFVIECKNYADYNLEDLLLNNKSGILKWITQLEKEKNNKLGLLIFKRNYGKIMCMVENVEFEPSFKWKNYYIGTLEAALPAIKKFVEDTSE